MLLFAMVAHEVAHAVVARSQGDDTAFLLGRITLNPIPHLDLWMSVVLPAMLWMGSGGRFTFGGAKPVPVDPSKYRSYRRGDLLVSSAGVATNLVLSLISVVLFILVGWAGGGLDSGAAVLSTLQRMLMWSVWINLLLCFFNLIPIPPLDGSHLLFHALPPRLGAAYRRLQRFGFLPLLVILLFFPGVTQVLLTPAFTLFGVFADLMSPFHLAAGSHIFS